MQHYNLKKTVDYTTLVSRNLPKNNQTFHLRQILYILKCMHYLQSYSQCRYYRYRQLLCHNSLSLANHDLLNFRLFFSADFSKYRPYLDSAVVFFEVSHPNRIQFAFFLLFHCLDFVESSLLVRFFKLLQTFNGFVFRKRTAKKPKKNFTVPMLLNKKMIFQILKLG